MNNDMNVSELLRGLRNRQIVYPAILIVLLISVGTSFYFVAQFLGMSITNALSTTSESSISSETKIQEVDMKSYAIVLKKISSDPSAANTGTTAPPSPTTNKAKTNSGSNKTQPASSTNRSTPLQSAPLPNPGVSSGSPTSTQTTGAQ